MELFELQAKIADLEQQIAELPAGFVTDRWPADWLHLKEDDQRQCVFLSPFDGEQKAAGEVYFC